MSGPNYEKLVDAAMAIRSHEPKLWDDFVKAMLDYAGQVLVELGRCPPDMLVRAQGMSIQATEIAGILRDAPQIQEQRQQALLKKQNNARKQQQPVAAWPPFT